MAKSSIEWTEKVWNPTTGCNKVSAGCKNCYAEVMHRRLMKMQPNKYSRPFLDGAFEYEPALIIPFQWKKPTLVFPTSMSDLFHVNISVEFIAKVYAIMFLTERHTYQMLTKRPQRRAEVLKSDEFFEYLWKYCNQYHDTYIKPLEQEMYSYEDIKALFPFKNIFEGTSIEDNNALTRADYLRETPATIRWISVEPLLESIKDINLKGIDWLVVGGESGNKKRPHNADWFRELRDKCKAEGVKFFMKQMDKVQVIPQDLMIRQTCTI